MSGADGNDDAFRAALADRYTLEALLGAGGMATVWRARDLRHDRDVALKVIRPDLVSTLGADRFLREVRVTAALQHPNILPLFDSGAVNGVPWYTMPYIAGESVRDRLRRERRFPVADAVRIARQVASALAHAHRHGVVHRDVKPDNVLLHDGFAYVADFGVALALARTDTERLTATGLAPGTLAYMSPEHATGEGRVDERSDQWSLAAMLYEMLTGEPPHAGSTVQATLARILTEPPTPLQHMRAGIPPGIATAVHRALSKDPADRFPTTEAFGAALEAALGSDPLQSGEADLGTQAARVMTPAGGERVSGVTSEPAVTTRRMPRSLWGALGAAVVLLVLWSALRPRVGGGADAQVVMAVLPCDDRTADSTLAHIAAGFAENLANRLTRISELHMVTRGEVRQALRSSPDLRNLARTLRATHIITCALDGAGDGNLRISAQLLSMRTAPARELWADAGTATRTDVLAVEDLLTRGVVANLPTLNISDAERRELAQGETRDSVAHALVLEGRAYWNRFTPEAMAIARTLYERALQRDSLYGEAWAALAAVDIALGATVGSERMSGPFERAKAVVARGLAVLPDHPTLLLRRANIAAWYDRDFAAAEADARRALALRPGDAGPHQTMQHVHAANGEFEAALAENDVALRLLPADPRLHLDRAGYLFLARRYPEAAVSAASAIDLDSLSTIGYVWRAYAAALLRDSAAAVADIERARALAPRARYLQVDQALILGLLGRTDAARELIEPVARDTTSRDAVLIAAALGLTGEHDRAFDWLERALRDGSRLLVGLAWDPRIGEELRGDPRFADVARRARLPRTP